MAARISRAPFYVRVDDRRQGSVGLRPHAIASFFTFATVAIVFCVSAFALGGLGIAYDTTGGSPLGKIHPASYAAVIMLAFMVWADGGPVGWIGRTWRETPGLLVFLGGLLILAIQAIVFQQKPASTLIDSFFLPLALTSSLLRLRKTDLSAISLFLHGFFALNSALSYIERASSWRLTPFMINGEAVTFDWRSSALLGHPLLNASETGLYILLLALGTGPFSLAMRAGLLLFHLGAMANFGGRTALVMTVLMLALIASWHIFRVFAGQRFTLNAAILTLTGVTLALAGAVILYDLGAFDPLIARFIDDNGSASARLQALSIYRDLTSFEFIFGPDQARIANTQRMLGLTVAIESTQLAFVAYYGLLVTLVFFAALGFYFREIIRATGLIALLPIGYFIVLVSTSTGIASKTTELAMISTSLICLLSRPRSGGGR